MSHEERLYSYSNQAKKLKFFELSNWLCVSCWIYIWTFRLLSNYLSPEGLTYPGHLITPWRTHIYNYPNFQDRLDLLASIILTAWHPTDNCPGPILELRRQDWLFSRMHFLLWELLTFLSPSKHFWIFASLYSQFANSRPLSKSLSCISNKASQLFLSLFNKYIILICWSFNQ